MPVSAAGDEVQMGPALSLYLSIRGKKKKKTIRRLDTHCVELVITVSANFPPWPRVSNLYIALGSIIPSDIAYWFCGGVLPDEQSVSFSSLL